MTKWTVIDAPQRDIGRGVVRIDPPAMEALNVGVGDAVWVRGERDAIARVMPSLSEHRGKSHAQMDGTVRENARVGLGDTVEILRADVRPAKRVELMPTGPKLRDEDLGFVGHRVDGIPVQRDDQLFVPLFGTRAAEFLVINTEPSGPVLVNENTTMVVHESKDADPAPAGPKVAFEDVGGLGGQLAKIRETIELPLRHPEIFRRLGIDPPRGVLLHGPPGCGKTLVARMIAREADAAFFVISGPEIIHKHYGESEAHLRRVFDEAAKRKPAIIFLDEVDAIAPRREDAAGDVERRVVATLLTLMDGLKDRGNLIVIAATNRPNAIDPALRRPGRFDREIAIPVPDRAARAQILAIHTRGMPLEPDVDLGAVADTTHGFVGADLEALCREAALACLRRVLPNLAVDGRFSPSSLRQLNVCHDDFDNALREIQPSATREVFVDVPNVSWDDVGGLKPIKTLLLEAVEWPIVHADLFASANVRAPRGILLCGPPGCGKTLLAKAVASQTQANFIAIKGPEIIDKYVGESERRLRETFRKAREASPCIVFFDEIDAIAPKRGKDETQVTTRVLAQFLNELDGVEDAGNVMVLAATNRMDMLDDAILRPGRFDHIIEIPPPCDEDRAEIFAIHLRDNTELEPLVEASDGLSGAEIAEACRLATMRALRVSIETKQEFMRPTVSMVKDAIADVFNSPRRMHGIP